MSTDRTNISESIEEANSMLDKLDATPFSDKAYSSMKSKINDFIGSMITESIRISKRQKADIVSKSHIELANDNLISKRKGKWKYLAGTIGGVFLGATASNTFGMLVLNSSYSTGAVTLTVIIGIIGAFLVAFNMNGD